jgi:ubiquinol-cytochrome c reductase cytochrome c1 subunit
MKNAMMRQIRGWLTVLAAGTALAIASTAPASAAEEGHIEIPKQDWSFGGMTGHFDNEQLRRGYLVYKNVCAACHGLRLLHYRNLSEPGGPEFAEGRVEEFAAEATVTDGPNDDGEMFTRPGKPADRFASPYPNAKAAAAANGGAVPPDLSVMAKARTIERAGPWFLEPLNWFSDIFTNYQEQGPDYLYALLTGYHEAPAGMTMSPGMYYNAAFPGHQIAMPPPLSDGVVTYPEGVPATLDNYARDVTAFMMWTAEPKLEERKCMGWKVLAYLAILAALLYLSKRALWRNVKH